MTRAPSHLHFAMLTRDALDAVRRAVRSLAQTTQTPFTLHVVDNGSTDETPAWLASHQTPWLRYLLNQEDRGAVGGRNDLLRFVLPEASDDDWIVFVAPELEFEAGWLAPFVAAMQRFPRAGVLGKDGHFVVVDDCGRELLPAPARTGHVDVVRGDAACFTKVALARELGEFDEELQPGGHDDDDWCVRALQHDHDVVAVPEASIRDHRQSSGRAPAAGVDHDSIRNLEYLAEKWRANGYVDRDGWIRRNGSSSYLPPQMRTELRRRMPHRGQPGGLPLGRLEVAQSCELLQQLIEQDEPLTWFDQHRQPIPSCFWPLLQRHTQQAHDLGERELAQRLTRIESPLRRAGNTTRVKGMLRCPEPQDEHEPRAGHGVCRDRDFDSPSFTRFADALGVGTLVRDPSARTAALWRMLATASALHEHGVCRERARVRFFGPVDARIPVWLARQGVEVLTGDEGSRKPIDAIVLHDVQDTTHARRTLLRHAAADTVVVWLGQVTCNGVPTADLPQPHQLALDQLPRTGLAAIEAMALCPDEGVLEACGQRPDDPHTPNLCHLDGPHVVTSFCVACRQARDEAHGVLQPARPLGAPTLTVGFDLRTLEQRDSTARGIGNYTSQHLAALCSCEPGLRVHGYVLDPATALPGNLRSPQISIHQIDDYDPAAVDAVHLPDPMNMGFGFDSPMRALRHPRTTVAFHDLTPLHHYLSQWPQHTRDAYMDRLRQLERGKQHLLTNSRFTALDVVRNTSIARERVTPILAGLHLDRGPAPGSAEVDNVHRQLGIDGPFVLHVGALDPHKNFYAALDAFLMARASEPRLQLVVVGAVGPGTTQAAAFCAGRRVPGVIFTGYLPHQYLDALYASAEALLFLSRAEGFALPVLEAMAKRCPVICSNTTSQPEVAGKAVLMVDPDDPQSAANHLRTLLTDAELREELRHHGHVRASQFTWRQVAERTIAHWRMLCSGRAPSRGIGATAQLG